MDVIRQLNEYAHARRNQNAFIPNSFDDDISLYYNLYTLIIVPWRTFIYLRDSNGDNFLQYLDEQLFGPQTGISLINRLKWFRNYLKEDDAGNSVFSAPFIKDIEWSQKINEYEKMYLFFSDKDATIGTTYSYFRRENRGLTFEGTVLDNFNTFKEKWSELLVAGFKFQLQDHHPVYDGTHNWNTLPRSLRRRWKRGQIESTDPFLILVNCCIAPILHAFFRNNTNLYNIYTAHYVNGVSGDFLQPAPFNPQYFRVPGPTNTCFYFSLPALWNVFHGYTEIEGLWNAMQYMLNRMTQVLRLPAYLMKQVTDSIPTFTLSSSQVLENVRNVDRSQRFLQGYTQTLNNQVVNQQGIIDSSILSEQDYINHASQTYSQNSFIESSRVVGEETDLIIHPNHGDERYTFRTRAIDSSIFKTNITFLETYTLSNDFALADRFLVENEYHIFSTGMVDDPRTIQDQIFSVVNGTNLSFHTSLINAKEYLVNMANSSAQFQDYLNEFFIRAVPRTIDITNTTIGSRGSSDRVEFYEENIKEYLEIKLRNNLQTNLNQLGNLDYRWDIRKLNYNEEKIIQEEQDTNTSLLNDIPNPNAIQSQVITTIQNRHTQSLGMNTSDIHPKASLQTPFQLYQISPKQATETYNYTPTTVLSNTLFDWNHVAVLPNSYSPDSSTIGSYMYARRYERTGFSVDRIRRPITYGDSLEMWKHYIQNDSMYWSVGDPISIVGNYGRQFIEENYTTELTNASTEMAEVILNMQPVIKNSLLQPYFASNKNLETIHSVLPKTIHIPMIDLLSNDIEDIIPRSITGDTKLELVIELEPFSNFIHEWTSSRKRNIEYNSQENGNYYIRDTHPKPLVSELELKNPQSIENEPTLYRSIVQDTLRNEIQIDSYSSYQGDQRNTSMSVYEMWNGYPIRTNHPEFEIPTFLNTVGDRTVFLDSLKSYGRYRTRPATRRFTESNQISIDRGLIPQFNFFGFSFTPEFNKTLFESQSFMRRFKQIQNIDKVQIGKQNESVKIDTIKQVFDIRFDATQGTDITITRGIDDEPIRVMYIESNEPKYRNNRFYDQFHKQRYLDGGGVWLGTNSIAIRYQQLGKDPNTIQDIEISNSNQAILSSIPQFDTNFRLSEEPRFPVFVEYPSEWKGLHGTVMQQDGYAPYINQVERPCIIWKSNSEDEIEKYKYHMFKSIVFDVSGDEIGPELDHEYYHSRFSYEHFERTTAPNIYGIQFGLGYWERQPLGYLDFGATANTNDRFFRFKTDQKVSRINTNLEKSVTLNFDLTWQNILYSRDGLLYTRYLR